MKTTQKIIGILITVLLSSCGFFTLVSELPAPRANEVDPWLDPYSVELETKTVATADQFGYAVAFDGDYYVVGAPEHNSGDGRAFVYHRTDDGGWGTPTELLPAVAAANADFGKSVAIKGNTIMVGAPAEVVNSEVGAGAVHVFVRTGSNAWAEDELIVLDDLSSGTYYSLAEDRFGEAVAYDGTWLAISAYHDDYNERGTDASADYGAVYFYKYVLDGWENQDRVDGRAFGVAEEYFDKTDNFGMSLAFGDDFIIVGSPFEDIGADTRAGVAYFFTTDGSTWSPAARIENPEPETSGVYGWTVSATVGAVTISAVGHTEDSKSAAGAVYFYAREPGGSWSGVANRRFVPQAPESNGYFGASAALLGSTLLIGAPFQATSGEVFVYEHSSDEWALDSVIHPSDGVVGFGFSMAVSADYAMFGATDGQDSSDGSVYLFTSN